MPIEIDAAKEVRQVPEWIPVTDPLDLLVCADATHVWVFKRSEQAFQESPWPEDMVVAEDGDIGRGVFYCKHHLLSLISSTVV